MTARLYYSDSWLCRFDATITEAGTLPDGRAFVVLDRTAFYPTSGGQPNDAGRLGDATVLDVLDRDDDAAVLHVLDRALAPGVVVSGGSTRHGASITSSSTAGSTCCPRRSCMRATRRR